MTPTMRTTTMASISLMVRDTRVCITSIITTTSSRDESRDRRRSTEDGRRLPSLSELQAMTAAAAAASVVASPRKSPHRRVAGAVPLPHPRS